MKIYIDEAGRGPLAGPLHIGMIIQKNWSKTNKNPLFRDSKKLSPKQREEAFEEISKMQKTGNIIALIAATQSNDIDHYGVTKAINFAISTALYHALCLLLAQKSESSHNYASIRKLIKNYENKHHKKIKLIIDGKSDFWLRKNLWVEVETIIKGDDKVQEIALASILAKLSRDRQMLELAKKYPDYAFEQHKGYGTQLHYAMIEQHGICPLHRKLFLKKLIPDWKISPFNEELPLPSLLVE